MRPKNPVPLPSYIFKIRDDIIGTKVNETNNDAKIAKQIVKPNGFKISAAMPLIKTIGR